MAKDVEAGRELAMALTDAYLGKFKKIEFTYDSFLDLGEMPIDPVIFITTENAPAVREGRAVVRREAQLRVTSISEAGVTDKPEQVDQFIDSFDQMIDLIYDTPVGLTRTRPTQIESESRYDDEAFHTHRRLVMSATITYRNL